MVESVVARLAAWHGTTHLPGSTARTLFPSQPAETVTFPLPVGNAGVSPASAGAREPWAESLDSLPGTPNADAPARRRAQRVAGAFFAGIGALPAAQSQG